MTAGENKLKYHLYKLKYHTYVCTPEIKIWKCEFSQNF